MGRKRNMPSRKKIFEYWKDTLEVNEGECFKCKQNIPLERAHILSVFDGGSDECDNLHLLCHSCHKNSEILTGIAYDEWFNYPMNNSIISLAYVMFKFANGSIKRLGVIPEMKEEEFRTTMKNLFEKQSIKI